MAFGHAARRRLERLRRGNWLLSQEDAKEYARKEYDYSSFTRSFTLPDYANVEKIMAHYENGILKLDIPKTAEGQKQHGQKIKVM